MKKKKATAKKMQSVSYREGAKLRKENRAQFGMPTKTAEAYNKIHEALILFEKGERQLHSKKELIEWYFRTCNFTPSTSDGSHNYTALKLGLAFEKSLDNLTMLLTGKRVVSKDARQALETCCDEVQKYYPITRRIESVKEETAKTRSTRKKKVAAKKKVTTKKKVAAKSVAPKKKVVAKANARKPKFVTYYGESVEADAVDPPVLTTDEGQDWDSFYDLLKAGKVTPSADVGYRDTAANKAAQAIRAIGGNRNGCVVAKNAISFLVRKLELSENVAKKRLYTLIDSGQLEIQ